MAAEIAGGCQDSSMTKLWKVISPGKKAAASGSDAAHAAAPRIDDAMRAAVATAAQRANERVAQQAGEAMVRRVAGCGGGATCGRKGDGSNGGTVGIACRNVSVCDIDV